MLRSWLIRPWEATLVILGSLYGYMVGMGPWQTLGITLLALFLAWLARLGVFWLHRRYILQEFTMRYVTREFGRVPIRKNELKRAVWVSLGPQTLRLRVVPMRKRIIEIINLRFATGPRKREFTDDLDPSVAHVECVQDHEVNEGDSKAKNLKVDEHGPGIRGTYDYPVPCAKGHPLCLIVNIVARQPSLNGFYLSFQDRSDYEVARLWVGVDPHLEPGQTIYW